ncbi:MAG: transposase [Marinobacter sp.]
MFEFNGESNHVHLVASCPPKTALSNFIGKLKGKSACVLSSEFWSEIQEKLWGNQFWSPL